MQPAVYSRINCRKTSGNCIRFINGSAVYKSDSGVYINGIVVCTSGSAVYSFLSASGNFAGK